MTNLEAAVSNLLGDTAGFPTKKEVQARLDQAEAVRDIMGQLVPEDILNHMEEAYSQTAEEYAVAPHNQGIVDELIEFMNLLPEGADVLDIGCGPGRDVLFMTSRNRDYRLSLMGRLKNGQKTSEKFDPPTIALRAVGIDQSEKMIAKCKKTFLNLATRKVPFSYEPRFVVGNMHPLPTSDNFGGDRFSGIWSCTALFTHTPHSLIHPAFEQLSGILMPNGVFSVSYTNGQVTGKYDKLLLSSTGKIKYFSQPDPEEVAKIAGEHGFKLEKQSFSDMEVNGQVRVKGLFVSQLFRKKS